MNDSDIRWLSCEITSFHIQFWTFWFIRKLTRVMIKNKILTRHLVNQLIGMTKQGWTSDHHSAICGDRSKTSAMQILQIHFSEHQKRGLWRMVSACSAPAHSCKIIIDSIISSIRSEYVRTDQISIWIISAFIYYFYLLHFSPPDSLERLKYNR